MVTEMQHLLLAQEQTVGKTIWSEMTMSCTSLLLMMQDMLFQVVRKEHQTRVQPNSLSVPVLCKSSVHKQVQVDISLPDG